MVKLHYFENRRHGLIIHSLAIIGTLYLGGKLIKADKDLFDVLQIAIMLPSKTLVFDQHIVS